MSGPDGADLHIAGGLKLRRIKRKAVGKRLRLLPVKRPSKAVLQQANANANSKGLLWDDTGRTKKASNHAMNEFTRIAREKGYL